MDEIELYVYNKNRRVILKQDTKFQKENCIFAAVGMGTRNVTNRLYEKRRVCVLALYTIL